MLSTVTPGNTSREHNESALPRAAVELQYLSLQCSQLTAESSETRTGHFREPGVGCIRENLAVARRPCARPGPRSRTRQGSRIELMTAVC